MSKEKASPKTKGKGIWKYTGEFLCKRCKNLGKVKGNLGCLAKNKNFHSKHFWFRKIWCKHYDFGFNDITFKLEAQKVE